MSAMQEYHKGCRIPGWRLPRQLQLCPARGRTPIPAPSAAAALNAAAGSRNRRGFRCDVCLGEQERRGAFAKRWC